MRQFSINKSAAKNNKKACSRLNSKKGYRCSGGGKKAEAKRARKGKRGKYARGAKKGRMKSFTR